MLLCVLLFVLLIAFMVARAWWIRSSPLPVAAIQLPEVNEKKAVNRISGALKIPTPSAKGALRPEDFLSLHRYLGEQFPLVHSKLQREVVGGFSLLYRWPGSDPSAQPILLMSHPDVVAVPHDEEVGGDDGNLQIALKMRERGVRFRFVLHEGGLIVDGAMP